MKLISITLFFIIYQITQANVAPTCGVGCIIKASTNFIAIDIDGTANVNANGQGQPTVRWDEARDYCTNIGSTLASITSQAEQNEVADLIDHEAADGFAKQYFWIGANPYGFVFDDATRSVQSSSTSWGVWQDGSSWGYTNWKPSEPYNHNNYGGTRCVYMHNVDDYWNDVWCGDHPWAVGGILCNSVCQSDAQCGNDEVCENGICTRLTFLNSLTFDAVSTDPDGNQIGWIKILDCVEGKNGVNYVTGNSDEMLELAPYAITAKIVPPGEDPNYAVQAKVCTNPVVALNNGKEMSFQLDVNTLQMTGLSDLNNWHGTATAKQRLANTCGAAVNDLSDQIYHACGNHGGLHLEQLYSTCEWDYNNLHGHDMEFYLGFDANKQDICDGQGTGGMTPAPDADPYTLILNREEGVFFTNPRSENTNNPEASTYSIVGDINYDLYKDNDGYMTFKLIYTYNGAPDDVIIWKQTSELLEGTITGYTPIDIPVEDNVGGSGYVGYRFEGLGLNTAYAGYSLLDCTGSTHSWFWGSVGEIIPYSGGTPAFNQKIAITETLYILDPAADIGSSARYAPIDFDPYNININTNNDEWIIQLTSTQLFGIGSVLSIILLVNIMCLCYTNCNGKKRKKRGYAVVKYDSESFDESEANVINVAAK